MAEDTGITFEHTVYYNFRANGPPDSKRETLTVGAYASAFLASFGVQGDFDKFWATHKDRAYWYGWLHAENLESEGQPARLKTLRERIEKFPEPDRSLYLIWLQSDFPTPLPATAAEITEAITRLGRGNIMALAELHMPADDPDLQFPANPGRFRYVTELILDHAQNVLTRADADRLSATYQQQRREFQDHHNARDNGPGVAYQILRARLMPDRASEILHEEIEARNGRFDGFSRDRLVAALFKLRGRAEMPFVREFFYGGGGKAVAALLESSDVALVDELLTDLRLGDLAPKDIAGLVETLPGIQQKLLVNWLYLQKENSPGFQNVQYFLRILNFTCNQSTYRAILLDPRLDKLSLSILFALEQETLSYKRPPEPRLTHDREIREYFALGSNKREPSAEAVAELVRFLRTVAPYVIAENITGGCWR